jgi:hypothetical protein
MQSARFLVVVGAVGLARGQTCDGGALIDMQSGSGGQSGGDTYTVASAGATVKMVGTSVYENGDFYWMGNMFDGTPTTRVLLFTSYCQSTDMCAPCYRINHLQHSRDVQPSRPVDN